MNQGTEPDFLYISPYIPSLDGIRVLPSQIGEAQKMTGRRRVNIWPLEEGQWEESVAGNVAEAAHRERIATGKKGVCRAREAAAHNRENAAKFGERTESKDDTQNEGRQSIDCLG